MKRTLMIARDSLCIFFLCQLCLWSAGAIAAVCPVPSQTPAPLVLYTDIESGPNAGGENNKGIYLSIFGKNFGSAGLGNAIRVLINDVEVDNYRRLGPSRGRADVDQITVQIGAIGNPPSGVKLPIKVVVDGRASNTDVTFTLNAGNIYFVNNVSGVDNASVTTGGGFLDPFKSVQIESGLTTTFAIKSAADAGAWGRVRAGDFVVLRGGTYKDIGAGAGSNGQGFFVQTLNKSGCPVGVNCAQGGGVSSGPITFMGYPNENVVVDRTNPGTAAATSTAIYGGGFSSADSARQSAGFGAWINVTNLVIESGYADGAINTQKGESNPLGGNWRVVNNELTGFSCAKTQFCRGGAIAGSGTGHYWVGNFGHDVYDQPGSNTDLENHGVYIGGSGSFEIAYNVFSKIRGGNGIQVQAFALPVVDLRIHHNVISDVGKHGLNFAAGVGNGLVVWNNIIADTDFAGARFSDDNARNLRLYNNTFYNVGRAGNSASGAALVNDTNAASGMFDIRNNIFWGNAPSGYASGCCNGAFAGGQLISNNLWFGAGAAPAFDTQAKTGNPGFIAAGSNFRLAAGSPAIDTGSAAVASVVVDDFDKATGTATRTLRPKGAGYDIGAFEY
jgi:hypothetical protein